MSSGQRVASLDDYGVGIDISENGVLAVVSGSEEDRNQRYVRLWSLKTRKRVARIGPTLHEPRMVALSRDGRRLVTGGCDPGTAELWDVETRQRLLVLDADIESVNAAVFVDDRTVAVGGRSLGGPPVVLWDISER